MTATIQFKDMEKLLNTFGLALEGSVKDHLDFFVDFGQRSSNFYRKTHMNIFEQAVQKGIVETKDFQMTIFLTVAVKNKNRIIQGLEAILTDTTWEQSDLTWVERLLSFFRECTVQYVVQAERTNFQKMPVVNIPGAFPSLASFFWKQINKARLKTMPEDGMLTLFLENPWAAQMRLDEELLDLQKEAERRFWNEKVTKTNNEDKARFQKGFVEEFWATKAMDTYPFIVNDRMDPTVFNKAHLTVWLLS
jgi:hypothetical protein